MKRWILLFAFTGALAGATAACDKPTADECKAAIENMQKLMGTSSNSSSAADNQAEVRRCRGGSSKTAIQCATAAKSLDELKACQFMTKPEAK